MNEDLSNILEKFNINKDSISPDMINNFIGIINSNQNNNKSTSNSAKDSPEIDVDTILKLKKVIEQMNKKNNDPRSKLLDSLRPYLRPSRQDKLDQYIQLMNLSKIVDILPFIGGENNSGTK